AAGFWERYRLDNPLGDAAILDLSLMANGGPRESARFGYKAGFSSPGGPGVRSCQLVDVSAIPAASVDLLVCDSAHLGRTGRERLTTQAGHSIDLSTPTGSDGSSAPFAAATNPPWTEQWHHLAGLLAQFSRVTKTGGV